MRALLTFALLFAGCATPKPQGNFEALFSERAHAAHQDEPYHRIDCTLWRFKTEPQPEDTLVVRYLVPPDNEGWDRIEYSKPFIWQDYGDAHGQ